MKKSWETPQLAELGSIQEKTETNAKLIGSFDGDPFEDCPPGQYKMDGCNGGGGAIS